MAEDKTPKPVIDSKENGDESKETTTVSEGDAAIEEKSDKNKLDEMQLDIDPAKDVDTVDEKLNDGKKAVEKKDIVAETAKENDKATETVEKEAEKDSRSEKTEAVEVKEAESGKPEAGEENEAERGKPDAIEGKEAVSEKPDAIEGKPNDADGKHDAVVDSNGKLTEGQEPEKDDVEEKEQKKSGIVKSGTKKANGKSEDVHEPKTPAASSFSIDRPVRERKSVERLVAIIDRDSSKEFRIEKGSGTALKDIPNVAYKLSRWKSDDTLKLLHGILFSRRGKAAEIKQNISKFSGFVWHGNEEKQKLKIKEKLEKYNKENLFEFCDILDLTISSKATVKKDEVVTLLLDFLIAPHATTDKLLAEKEESSKGSKRKRADKGTPGSGSAKSRKKRGETSKSDEKTISAETDNESEEDAKENEDDEAVTIPETKESTAELSKISSSDEKLSEPDSETVEFSKNKKKRPPKKHVDSDVKTPKVTSSSKKTSGSTTETIEVKRKRTPSSKNNTSSEKETPRSSKKSKVDSDKATSPKASSKKQKEEKQVKEKNVSTSKEKSGKVAASKVKKKTNEEPTDERLREEACIILKEVDFNTATFTDILKILAERFKTDLTPRKSVIKVMIQEELTKLANEEEEDEDEEEEDGKTSTEDEAPKA